jgi:hypothetical protein
MTSTPEAAPVAFDPKALVRDWVETARMIERMRRERLRRIDTAKAILALSDAFDAARARHVSRTHSGLVEQQDCFGRAYGRPG